MLNRGVVLILFLAVSLFLIAANVQAGFLFIISSCIVSVLVISYVVPFLSVRSLDVSRVVPAEAFEFEEIPVELTIHNKGRMPKVLLRVEDGFLGGDSQVIAWLPRKASRTVHDRMVPRRRGKYGTAPVTISCGAPFGIVRMKRTVSVPANLTVYPMYVDLPSFPVLESQSVPYETLHERRAKGAGYDYLGTREYRAGDSLRMVHWRSSARRGELVVKEYEEEAASPVNIIIGPAAEGDLAAAAETEDCAVRIAASIARYVSQVGHPVQLFAADKGGSIRLSAPSFWQVLEWLSEVKPDADVPVLTVIKNAEPYLLPRSTLVVIAERHAPDWIEEAPAIQAKRVRIISVVLGEEAEPEDTGRYSKTDRINVYRYKIGEDLLECLKKPSSYTSG